MSCFTIDIEGMRRSFAAVGVLESVGSQPTIRMSYDQAREVVVVLWAMLPLDERPVPR